MALSLALASNQLPSKMNEIMKAAPSKNTWVVDEKIEGRKSRYGANTTREDQIIAVVVPIWTRTSMFALPDRIACQAPLWNSIPA